MCLCVRLSANLGYSQIYRHNGCGGLHVRLSKRSTMTPKTKQTYNKCVSKTDTNPPFEFQIAFPRDTDFTGFLQGGSKNSDLQSEISVRNFESNLESNRRIVVYSFSVKFFLDCHIEQVCGFIKNIARSLLGYYCACSNYNYMN